VNLANLILRGRKKRGIWRKKKRTKAVASGQDQIEKCFCIPMIPTAFKPKKIKAENKGGTCQRNGNQGGSFTS